MTQEVKNMFNLENLIKLLGLIGSIVFSTIYVQDKISATCTKAICDQLQTIKSDIDIMKKDVEYLKSKEKNITDNCIENHYKNQIIYSRITAIENFLQSHFKFNKPVITQDIDIEEINKLK